MVDDVSVGFVVCNYKREFLLLRKSVDGVWDFPKGHFNVGEVDEKLVAFREFEEETGLKRSDLFVVSGFRNEHSYVNDVGVVRRIVLFLGLLDVDPVLSGEHSDFVWVDSKMAKELLRFPEKVHLVDDVLLFINS